VLTSILLVIALCLVVFDATTRNGGISPHRVADHSEESLRLLPCQLRLSGCVSRALHDTRARRRNWRLRGKQKTLLNPIQEENAKHGRPQTRGTDMQFGYSSDEQLLLINKADSVIRSLGPWLHSEMTARWIL
jgi:hypothetical protein